MTNVTNNKLVIVGIVYNFHLLTSNLSSTQPELGALLCLSIFRPSGWLWSRRQLVQRSSGSHQDAVEHEPTALSCRTGQSNHFGRLCSLLNLFRPRSGQWEAAPTHTRSPATSGFPWPSVLWRLKSAWRFRSPMVPGSAVALTSRPDSETLHQTGHPWLF